MTYEPVIGLEIHIQAKTKSKMFCSCSSEYFGAEPNTHVCPVCLGLPGALPVPNKFAIDQVIKLALALNCEINQESKFDRKNYFYPDLPKSYQISQYDYPVGKNGYLEVEVEGDARRIRIKRIHIEEDTGKSIHEDGTTLLDFNKSGVPLMEVVTEPDFQDLREVTAFAKMLKKTVEYLNVSDAEMQKGQMRFELNISVRPAGSGPKLPDYKVEIKNIGSISVLEKVIEFEVERQSQALDKGEKMKQQTRGIRDMTGETYFQRSKEGEDDYRYFPEPDIPPFSIATEHIEEIRAQIPELPTARSARYQSWGLDNQQAEILVDQNDKGDWIDELAKQTENKALVVDATKWMLGDIAAYLEKSGTAIADMKLKPSDLLYLVDKVSQKQISGTIVKQVLTQIFENGGNAETIITSQGLMQINDESAIQQMCEKIIAENPQVVASLAKNPNAIKALVGKVMGESKGKANPQTVEGVLRKLLSL